jgi:hypothetical protein
VNVAEIPAGAQEVPGGGYGFYRRQIQEAQASTRSALAALRGSGWGVIAQPGRGRTMEATSESVRLLNEIVHLEAPHDVVEDTRHALAALRSAENELRMLDPERPVEPRTVSTRPYERALDLLASIEQRLSAAGAGVG